MKVTILPVKTPIFTLVETTGNVGAVEVVAGAGAVGVGAAGGESDIDAVEFNFVFNLAPSSLEMESAGKVDVAVPREAV